MKTRLSCIRSAVTAMPALVLALVGLGSLSGCASEGGPKLPAVIAERWSPPAFATRSIDADDPRVVIAACKQAALAGGYAVQRYDAESGFLTAARRQSTAFDGSRQDTLEVRVSSSAPGRVRVATVLREVVESGSRGERDAGAVTSGLVRDRSSYDTFFERLAALLDVR